MISKAGNEDRGYRISGPISLDASNRRIASLHLPTSHDSSVLIRKVSFLRSLHFKQLAPLIFLGALLAWVGAYLLHLDSSRKQRLEMFRRVELVVLSIERVALSVRQVDDFRRYVESLGQSPDISFLAVTAGIPAKVVAANYPALQGMAVSAIPDAHAADMLQGVLNEGREIQHFFDADRELHFARRLSLPMDGLALGPSTAVVIFYDATPLRAALDSEARYLALWLTIMLAALGLTAYMLFWRTVLRPIGRIGQSLQRFAGLGVGESAVDIAQDEIGLLASMLDRSLKRVEYLAFHDVLTGLPNRELFRERIAEALAAARSHGHSVALLFMDLDNFKTVNDGLGHAFGDLLLTAMAGRLRAVLRRGDTLSRQGGDEFLVVLPNIRDIDEVTRMASLMLEEASKPLIMEGQQLQISFSIGISRFPEDGNDVEVLLRCADRALYAAKKDGRNAFRVFTASMDWRAREHLKLQSRLHRAVENAEFLLHYQPQVDLRTGGVTGVEALLRWPSESHGPVSPESFITVAEEAGLIVPIGLWVLREACGQAAGWRRQGLGDLKLAVNLSALQIQREDFPSQVERILAETGFPATCLELELTESMLIGNRDVVMQVLRRIKSLGVRIAIDDFGTGYSSLAYLRDLAVDTLKIDRSFVKDFVNDADSAAIVRAITQLASGLSLITVAEGVEHPMQLHALAALGCHHAQGFFIGRPMEGGQVLLALQQIDGMPGPSFEAQVNAKYAWDHGRFEM